MRPLARLAIVVGAAAAGAGGAAGCSDGNAPPSPIQLSGVVRDDFSGAPVAGVVLTAEGLTPPPTATSSSTGEYEFADVDRNTVIQVSGVAANYRPTKSPYVFVANSSIVADLSMVSSADAARQYTGLGLVPSAGMSVLFVAIVDPAGQPQEGIPAADVRLVDGVGASIGIGPFFFGMSGDVVSNATLGVSTAFGGRARVGFLDVPLGTHAVEIALGSGVVSMTVVAGPDGATLLTLPVSPDPPEPL